MTALYNAAKKALRLARECEVMAMAGNRRDVEYWTGEAKRHRDRARWYLSRRNLTVYPLKEAHHEHAA